MSTSLTRVKIRSIFCECSDFDPCLEIKEKKKCLGWGSSDNRRFIH